MPAGAGAVRVYMHARVPNIDQNAWSNYPYHHAQYRSDSAGQRF